MFPIRDDSPRAEILQKQEIPNWMNRMVRFLKNDQVPQIKKVGVLFAAVISVLFLAFVSGKIICGLTVLGLARWAYVEKRNCDEVDKVKAALIQREKLLEAQRAYIAKMKEAFGGEEIYNALPHLDIGNRTGDTGYIDFLTAQELSKPIMKGTDVLGRPFIALRLCFKNSDNKNPFVIALFQRYADGGSWSFGSRKDWDTFQTRLDDRDWNVVRQLRAGNHHRVQLV